MSHAHGIIRGLKTSVITFDGTGSTTVLHILSRFLEECSLEQTLKTQACLIVSIFFKEKDFEHFLAARNDSSYTKLRHWQNFVKYFLFTYATTAAIQNKDVQFKDLKELPRETKIKYCSRVNEIAYRCGDAISLEDKISKFIFGLQSTIQTIFVHETEGLDDGRQPLENAVQIERKEGKAYRAPLSEPLLIAKLLMPICVPSKTMRTTRSWCTEKEVTTRTVAYRIKWCHHYGFIAPTKIIEAFVLDGLKSLAKQKARVSSKYCLLSMLCPWTLLAGLLTTLWAQESGYC